ncbi:MAG: FHA domain-containing protein [Gammaproteobacteria bacterium]|nr:FHA domain-containing protein [Gammaproteobacteria bacterium]
MTNKESSQFNSLHNRVAYIDSTLRQAKNLLAELDELLDKDRQADGALAAELFNLDRLLAQLDTHMHKSTPQPVARTRITVDTDRDRENRLLLQALDAQEDRIRQLEEQLKALSNDDDRLIDRANSSRYEQEQPEVLTNESLQNDPYANRMIVTIQDGGNLKLPLNNSITTIGREPANDVQIRSRFVSRFHARIVSDRDGATIEDLDSRNGVAVNAEKVRRRQLRNGDFIKIGRIQLQYIDIMEGEFGSRTN